MSTDDLSHEYTTDDPLDRAPAEAMPAEYDEVDENEAYTQVGTPPPVITQRTPSSMTNRLVRFLLIAVGAVIALLVVIVVIFSLYKGSHNQPIAVEAYPNAAKLSTQTTSTGDETIYQTDDTVDVVADFYSHRLGSTDEVGCKLLYTVKVVPDVPAPGDYFYRCIVDSSVLDVPQLVSLTITFKADPAAAKNGGHTLIDVQRIYTGGGK